MAEAKMLETMQSNPMWGAASYPDVVDILTAADYAFEAWGSNWCGDCCGQLPDFVAALDTTGIPAERIGHYPVEKADNGSRIDPFVGEYDIELVPTVTVEHNDKEVARSMEEEDVSTAVYLTDELPS